MASVSIFVPCYGYGHLLRACVESILGQPGVDVRVLIIDDCSPDETPEVGAALALDPRVEYRRHETNQRHIATYNEGIEWADGDYTMLLSADDMLTEGALERATRVLDANPNVSLAYGKAIVWNDQHPLPPRSAGDGSYRVMPGVEWIELVCRFGDNVVYSPEVISRTSVQKQVGGYSPDLPHTGDLHMWLRLAALGDVAILDADQAYYRIHGDNMHSTFKLSTVDLEQRRDAYYDVLDHNADRLPNAAQLRSIVQHAVVRNEIDRASESIDQGRGRREALHRLRNVYHFDRTDTITNYRSLLLLLLRLVLGRGYQSLRQIFGRVLSGFGRPPRRSLRTDKLWE